MADMNDIRKVLENKLVGIAGIPDIVHENFRYDPDQGTPHIRATLIPVARRPATRGPLPRIRTQGLFSLLVCTPEGEGSGSTQDYVDLVLTEFAPHVHETYDGSSVSIDYSESSGGYFDSPFYCIPVSIGWHTYN